MKRRRCTTCKHTMKGHRKKHCTGIKVLFLESGHKYVGCVYNDKPSGLGILEDEHSTYEGLFLNGKKHGYGTETFASGRCYIGQWSADLFHGNGVLHMDNGSTYKGDFNLGTYHGYGELLRPEESFVGYWHHGTYHGHGTHTTTNGTFEGQFYFNARCGHGIFTDHQGNKYNGSWHQGRREGHGVYTTADSIYTGLWKHNVQSGHGVLVSKNLGEYVGNFKRGKRHQYGIQTKNDGTVYKGGWSKGKQTGHGTLTWPDGSSYCGFWLRDKYNGRGILRTADQGSFRGEWEFGQREGEFTENKPNGSVSIGPWTNDVRHGTFLEDGRDRYLYIWGSKVQFKSLAHAKKACKNMSKVLDYEGVKVILQHFPTLCTWKFFFKFDQNGTNLDIMDKNSIIDILQKYSYKLFKAKRYLFLENLFRLCPEEALEVVHDEAEELFDVLSNEFVPNPWIVRDQSYSRETKKKLLDGLFLGELGRCPPKDPFTRLPLNEKSGKHLTSQPKRAKEIYNRFMNAIGSSQNIRDIARSFDVQDFEELLKNAREDNDRDTIKRIMKERKDYIEQNTT